jgi:hypothetical protein
VEIAHHDAKGGDGGEYGRLVAEQEAGRMEVRNRRERMRQGAQGAVGGRTTVTGELPEHALVATVVAAAAIAERVGGGATGAAMGELRSAHGGDRARGERGEAGRQSVEDHA